MSRVVLKTPHESAIAEGEWIGRTLAHAFRGPAPVSEEEAYRLNNPRENGPSLIAERVAATARKAQWSAEMELLAYDAAVDAYYARMTDSDRFISLLPHEDAIDENALLNYDGPNVAMECYLAGIED